MSKYYPPTNLSRQVAMGVTYYIYFEYGSLPYLLSWFFWSGVTFPLVALDEI